MFRSIFITAGMRIAHDIHILFRAYPVTWAISSAIFLACYLKSDWLHAYERDALRR